MPFLRYDAAKASIDEVSDDHQVSTSRPFSLRYVRLSMGRGHDRILSVCVMGPSSVHTPYAKATAGLLNRRRHVCMSEMHP